MAEPAAQHATAGCVATTDAPVTLDVRGLTIALRQGSATADAVTDVSFAVPRGGALGIVGESGCGKTLTALAAIDLLPSVASIRRGAIRIGGVDVVTASRAELRRLRGRQVGVVFQDPLSALNPTLRVGEQIAERLRYVRRLRRSAASKRAIELLELVGIPDPARRSHHYPHQFSGGMRQRIMFALAISCEPELLIADEPTTSLDVTTQAQIMSLVADLRRELHLTLVFISHDLALVGAVCDDIAVMYAGQIVESGRADELLEDPQHPYTRAILAAIPDPIVRQDFVSIPGRPPMPGTFPAGCRFGPRCSDFRAHECNEPVDLITSADAAVRCRRIGQLTSGRTVVDG